MAGIFKRKKEDAPQKSAAPRIIERYACEPGAEGKAHILEKHNARYASLLINCGYGDNLCFVGSDEKIEVFGIACGCGSRKLRITGREQEGREQLGEPVSIACAECGEQYTLIGEAAQGSSAGKRAICPQCGHDTFELTLGFEYPEDAEDAAKAGKKEVRDVYTWITGCAKCEQCGNISDILDFECD